MSCQENDYYINLWYKQWLVAAPLHVQVKLKVPEKASKLPLSWD